MLEHFHDSRRAPLDDVVGWAILPAGALSNSAKRRSKRRRQRGWAAYTPDDTNVDVEGATGGRVRCSKLDDRRWYATSTTGRVQEIVNYGETDEHALAPGTGRGFLWRLLTLTRLESRNGGVLVEVEAIALRRDIPGALRWIVDPIVRRVSKHSLMTSARHAPALVSSMR